MFLRTLRIFKGMDLNLKSTTIFYCKAKTIAADLRLKKNNLFLLKKLLY